LGSNVFKIGFLKDLMNLIFIGVQGSGKGTLAKIISKELEIEHISTGDLLRDTKGELKKETGSYITKGNLVPDELILKILKKKLKEPSCKKGFILEGFPRNLKQMEVLNNIIKIDKIIEIKISDREAIERIVGRRNCPECGKIYNLYKFPKPKNDNLCDDCKVELFQRDDDTLEFIKERIKIYHKETEPILKKYPSIKVDGERNVEEVSGEILRILN
jgi:adenylate kinase